MQTRFFALSCFNDIFQMSVDHGIFKRFIASFNSQSKTLVVAVFTCGQILLENGIKISCRRDGRWLSFKLTGRRAASVSYSIWAIISRSRSVGDLLA
ncbi:hypothetical protein [Microcoleus sp. B13-B6]|uniref:hypothetical protein n=1 Tax=Microcoleus sp. B13-B6 TaxID=2818652 RepID=UPI002FCFD8AB